MSGEDETPRPEKEEPSGDGILDHHKFSVAEVIGRSAGGLLKGTSPITRRRQAEIEIELALEDLLIDAEGALGPVLLRHAKASRGLVSVNEIRPLEVLADTVRSLLTSDERLRDFVREVDAEWGRIYEERPYFEVGDGPPHRDDPYPVSGARGRLEALLTKLGDATDR